MQSCEAESTMRRFSWAESGGSWSIWLNTLLRPKTAHRFGSYLRST